MKIRMTKTSNGKIYFIDDDRFAGCLFGIDIQHLKDMIDYVEGYDECYFELKQTGDGSCSLHPIYSKVTTPEHDMTFNERIKKIKKLREEKVLLENSKNLNKSRAGEDLSIHWDDVCVKSILDNNDVSIRGVKGAYISRCVTKDTVDFEDKDKMRDCIHGVMKLDHELTEKTPFNESIFNVRFEDAYAKAKSRVLNGVLDFYIRDYYDAIDEEPFGLYDYSNSKERRVFEINTKDLNPEKGRSMMREMMEKYKKLSKLCDLKSDRIDMYNLTIPFEAISYIGDGKIGLKGGELYYINPEVDMEEIHRVYRVWLNKKDKF